MARPGQRHGCGSAASRRSCSTSTANSGRDGESQEECAVGCLSVSRRDRAEKPSESVGSMSVTSRCQALGLTRRVAQSCSAAATACRPRVPLAAGSAWSHGSSQLALRRSSRFLLSDSLLPRCIPRGLRASPRHGSRRQSAAGGVGPALAELQDEVLVGGRDGQRRAIE